MILAVLAVLVADAMVVVPRATALGSYQAFWNSTTGFNTGTKVVVDSASNSCLASGQGIQLNATGGNYGVTTRCPTGAPSISPANLTQSTDASTYNRTSANNPLLLLDFSPNQYNLRPVNGVRNVTDGVHGNAVWLGAASYLLGGSYCGLFGCPNLQNIFPGVSSNKLTIATNLKSNFTNDGATHTILGINTQGAATGYIWMYIVAGSQLTVQWGDPAGGAYNAQCGPNPWPLGTAWHSLVLRMNYTSGTGGHMGQCAVDGTIYPAFNLTVSAGRSLTRITSATLWYWGSYGGSASNFWKGDFDDIALFTRWLSNSETLAFMTSGVYATSGSWTSPSVTTRYAQPTRALIGWSNVSSSAYLSFKVYRNGTLAFSSPNFKTGSSNISQVNLTFTSYGWANWTMEIDLYGSGNTTPYFLTAALMFVSTAAPTPVTIAPTIDRNAMIFIVFLILVFGLGFAGFGLELPILTVLGGIAGFVFGGWLFFTAGASNVPLAVVLWGVSSIFMLMGAVMALQTGD